MPAEDSIPSRHNSIESLLLDARSGEHRALGQLMNQCRDYLLLVANRELPVEVRQKEAASDIVQDTFLEARQCFENFRGASGDELRWWLRRILINNVSDARRKYQRTGKRTVSREVSLDRDPVARRNAVSVVSDGISPLKAATINEDIAKLNRAIEKLPDHYQEVLQLHNGNMMSFGETGELMDRSADSTRKLWLRALARLRQELTNRNDSDYRTW